MSEIQFLSTFASASFKPDSASHFPSASSLSTTDALDSSSPGSFASFIFHVAYLEKRNHQGGYRHDESVFFDTTSEIFGARQPLGEGASFRVERAEWRRKDPSLAFTEQERKRSKYVALKGVVSGQSNDWQDVLLEIRALLHEPLRYHPNIARLLGLGWGPIADSNSIHPLLVMEYAELGSLHSLQSGRPSLHFAVKQKLCYDVARGLAILHACGIVHGDLKHENVLIFQNSDNEQPYVAKLADFGGSVMDLAGSRSHSLRMGTYPYNPPESTFNLSREDVKKTDVYSFGLLVWRTVIDGSNLLSVHELRDRTIQDVQNLKESGQIITFAITSSSEYATSHSISEYELARMTYVYIHTIHPEASERDLTKAQAALKGERLDQINSFLKGVEKRNETWEEAKRNKAPGSHGITPDGLGYFLAKTEGEYDPQDNCPGYRPVLTHPDPGEFHFDPLRLKKILDWHQQTRVVCDLERAAASQPIDAAVDIRPWMASYFLFQCYVAEFGVVFDEQKACYWIAKAAENEDGGGVNYYAQAWLFRMHIALRVPISLSPDAIRSLITISVFRGHRTCIEDAELILQQPAPVKESMLWRHPSPLSGDAIDAIIEDTPEILRETLNLSTRALHTTCAAVGMPYFLGRKLKKQWNLDNLQILDGQIQEELGRTYSHSLLHGRDSTKPTTENGRDGTQLFDKIYVNHRGHGLLHLASAMGNLTALTHLLSKYKTDIDLPNKSSEESPLVCSCRAGHFDCSMLLLKHGANPSGHELGGESPLHWLCSFSENEMPVIAKRLQAAGAPIEEASGTTRADVRNIWADWEELYTVCVTPLGRAVIMKSLPAVRVLLTLGANPLARPQLGETGTVGAKSAVELAAVLTLPEILDVLLTYLDMVSSRPPDVLDEVEMLRSAHSLRSITPYDPTTLQSRLVRCGRDYKICLHKTMEILQQRRKRLSSLYDDNGEKIPEGDQLCQEIRLGNFDVVETLLNLGQDVNGFLDRRPVVEAVLLNAENIFRLLISYGADPFTSAVLDDCHPMSLLQVSASKPKTSRPGLHIANHLIKSGVAIDPTQVGQRSAFVLAVKNHDFELADLLLNYGADINFIYQLSNGGDWVTVLHELLQHHSEKNLKAIEYVLGAGAAQHTSTGFGSSTETPRCLKAISASSRKPDLVCNKTTKTSALQILALCSPETWNTKSQVSSRITQVLLAVFNTPDDINYQHPIAGTALLMACFSGNLEVVTALLACKADKSISIDFANSSVVNTLQGRVPVGVPLLIAKLKLFIENGINPQGDELPRLKSIVEMLTGEEMQEDEITTEGIRSVQFIDADAPDQGVEDNDSTYRSIAVKSPQPGPQGATSAHGEPTVQTSPAPHKFEVSRIPRQAHRTGTSQESINHSLSAPDSEIIRVQYNSLPMNVDLQTNKDKEHEHLVDDWVKRTTQDGQSYPVKYLSKTTSWPHSGVLNPNNNPSQGWEARKTQNGELYYIDRINKTTTGERSQSDRKEITYALSSGREGGQTDKGRLYGVDHNSERTSWVSPQVKVRPPLPFRKAESLRPPELPPRRPVLPPRRPFGA